MEVNLVDLRRDQHRQIQVLRLRAEQQMPVTYGGELAEARWQINHLNKKLAALETKKHELEVELDLFRTWAGVHATAEELV